MQFKSIHFEISTRKVEVDANTGYAMIRTGKEPDGELFQAPEDVPLERRFTYLWTA